MRSDAAARITRRAMAITPSRRALGFRTGGITSIGTKVAPRRGAAKALSALA
jgi:hypothetical protein